MSKPAVKKTVNLMNANTIIKIQKDSEWKVVGSVTSAKYFVENELVAQNNVSNQRWNKIFSQPKTQKFTVNLNGIFVGDDEEQIMLLHSIQVTPVTIEIENDLLNYKMQGNFYIKDLAMIDTAQQNNKYDMVLVNDGKITITKKS